MAYYAAGRIRYESQQNLRITKGEQEMARLLPCDPDDEEKI